MTISTVHKSFVADSSTIWGGFQAEEQTDKMLTGGIVFQIIDGKDELSQVACPITTKLILDQDEETKNPLVQVHRNLVTRLKPHQVDG